MKLYLATLLVASASAFAPSPQASACNTALHAEQPQSRQAFLSAAAAFGVMAAAMPAMAMDQEFVDTPTEQWETGKPTAAAEKARVGRYDNARTQMTSNFAPIKRLTLERKSPVTRLDINSPDFSAYKKTYPGLFKEK